MTLQEKIIVFRRVWREGQGKFVIAIPKEVVEHYKLEGKLVKATLEVVEDESKPSN
jgi:hypothetical protein